MRNPMELTREALEDLGEVLGEGAQPEDENLDEYASRVLRGLADFVAETKGEDLRKKTW